MPIVSFLLLPGHRLAGVPQAKMWNQSRPQLERSIKQLSKMKMFLKSSPQDLFKNRRVKFKKAKDEDFPSEQLEVLQPFAEVMVKISSAKENVAAPPRSLWRHP